MTDQPDLFDPDRPPRDLFAKDTSGRCMPCRAGSHRACRGRRQCTCPALVHSAIEANDPAADRMAVRDDEETR